MSTHWAPAPVRKVSVYRGDPGMWAWVLHRITGVTIFFFLFVHVLDTAVIRINAEEYDAIINTYKTPIIGLMEIALVFCVLFHAFNGVRVILIDFWSRGRATSARCSGWSSDCSSSSSARPPSACCSSF